MQRSLLLFVLLFTSMFAASQELKRVEVNGRIIVNVNDVEGVTVYNTSTNKGTITDENGEFKIKVGLNDNIEISALQFVPFSLKIDDIILKSKQLTVYLFERINKLDEVVILPYRLTGNLADDLDKVKMFNPDMDAIYFGIRDIGAYEFGDDQYSKVDNPLMYNGELQYGADIIGLVGILLNPLFKSKNNRTKNKDQSEETSKRSLTDIYGNVFISNNFKIPIDKVEAFIAFVENNGLEQELLEEGNQMQLIEFLIAQSKLFLKS